MSTISRPLIFFHVPTLSLTRVYMFEFGGVRKKKERRALIKQWWRLHQLNWAYNNSERSREEKKIVNWQVNTALFLSFKNYLKLSSPINRTQREREMWVSECVLISHQLVVIVALSYSLFLTSCGNFIHTENVINVSKYCLSLSHTHTHTHNCAEFINIGAIMHHIKVNYEAANWASTDLLSDTLDHHLGKWGSKGEIV